MMPALWRLSHRAPFPCHLNSDSIIAMRLNQFTPQVGGNHLMVGSNRLPGKACFETMLGTMVYLFRIRVLWAGTPTVNGVPCGVA